MVLLHCGEKRLLGDLYFSELAGGLENALSARGLGPVIVATRETLQGWVVAKRAKGVVLPTGAERRDLAREFAGAGTACVVIDQDPPEAIHGVGWIHLDLDSGAKDVARLLYDHGHRRMGFIGNSEDDHVLKAFTAELKTLDAPLRPELSVIAGVGRAAGISAMRSLLAHNEPPTAVFARTDVLASGALQAARELGVRVPEEVSVVGHDDIPLAESLGLTTVRIDCRELGQAAAEVLERVQKNGSTMKKFPIIRTSVVIRSSVARRK